MRPESFSHENYTYYGFKQKRIFGFLLWFILLILLRILLSFNICAQVPDIIFTLSRLLKWPTILDWNSSTRVEKPSYKRVVRNVTNVSAREISNIPINSRSAGSSKRKTRASGNRSKLTRDIISIVEARRSGWNFRAYPLLLRSLTLPPICTNHRNFKVSLSQRGWSEFWQSFNAHLL